MIGVLTYNPGGRPKPGALVDWFRAVRPRVHVVNLQESMKWVDEVQEAWPFMQVAVDNRTPILYDRRHLRLVRALEVPLTDRAFVGREGAGPATLAEKVLSAALFEHHGNGRRFWNGNLHAAPSIHVHKQPGAEISRDELHEAQMAGAVEFFARKRLPCLLNGDFNAEWGHSNLADVRRVFKKANPPGGTHGRRQIDLMLHKGRVKPTDLRMVIPGLVRDDHDAVFCRYRFC